MTQTPKVPNSVGEIFPIEFLNKNCQCFRVSPNIGKEIGNRLSWQLSTKYPDIIVIWDREDKYFCMLGKPEITIFNKREWQDRLNEIQEQLKDDIGERNYILEEIRNIPEMTANVKAELAIRVLKINNNFSAQTIYTQNQVSVKTELDYWAETFEYNQKTWPAIAFNTKTEMIYDYDLQYFFEHHPERNQPEQILVGLQVKDIEKNSIATIVDIAGIIGNRRNELLEKASRFTSREKLLNADDNEPIVSVKFGKNSQLYDYPLAALIPRITAKTANLFGVKYGDLSKETKLTYCKKQEYTRLYREAMTKCLATFKINSKTSINTRDQKSLFIQPTIKLEDVKLLFGKGVIKNKNRSLSGLQAGGVYRRHKDFLDSNRKIRLAILKPTTIKVGNFRKALQEQLKSYKFESLLPPESSKNYDIDALTGVEARAKLEEIVDDLIQVPTDIVLVFLPTDDRDKDETEEGSLYSWIKSRLLRRNIASQVIYEDTLKKALNDEYEQKNILNQVVIGILAKLGNLPFILAEPLEIADAFVGLDISRMSNQKTAGSRNICASVRFYGKQGEFIQYRLEDSFIEGEEIPQRTIENFFPQSQFKTKTVLIYRDGRFQGEEVNHLLGRAKAINAKFILVECVKSQIPRLYNLSEDLTQINAPTRGLGLKLSEREVILVTTQVKETVGIPRPLRLRIHEAGEQASLES
ncbi:Piwi domain-containing protein [Crocosphaera sp. UHCC 0190]|uniref:Piwi domain-containing protein n=1 Tax=Crocosphaera sp. UHCC 0190 TaxID=3110246 RepID=UPI002B21B05C|nr:Piwi domain-containing protein [Crocosphaera sp. UHCC 0190]MEA5509058.1 Piwi domain-containing protein [Crocosphaera sp. UHCC 0190]